MANGVYHFQFLNELLPESDEGKAAFARENTAKLTGGAEDEVIFFMQPHNHEPTCRLTSGVPERLPRALGALRAVGAVPAFWGPEGPYQEDNTLVLPGSFQVLKFGRWLDPRSVENNPARMQIIAEEAAKAVPDLPDEVKDILNWTVIYADEENGTAGRSSSQRWRNTTGWPGQIRGSPASTDRGAKGAAPQQDGTSSEDPPKLSPWSITGPARNPAAGAALQNCSTVSTKERPNCWQQPVPALEYGT